MDLVPYIYWERQEAGSQLCAQHCLNNLLQAHTYSEFDLADIARKLDQAENAALSTANQNKKSYNFDDTGYFSISVLERAMEVWDLTLVRWRGEAMRPYQEKPEEQAAFILHLSSHWIPLRRFSPHPLPASSTKRWYNLNSFLPNGPEWISPTYLRMVLTQAEEEGYSVFVVRKATPEAKEGLETKEAEGWGDGGVGVIPESEADRMAMVLGEPVGRSGGVTSPTRSGFGNSTAGSSRVPLASINPDQPTVDLASVSSPAGPSSPPTRRRGRRQEDLVDPTATDDYAQIQPPRPPRNPARNASQDVLDDETGTFPEAHGEQGDEEYQEVVEDDEHELEAAQRRYDHYAGGPTDFTFQSRSYDDEDAALQAALKASMEDLPADWVPPVIEPKEKPIQKAKSPIMPPVPTAPPPVTSQQVPQPASGSRFKEEVEDDDDTPAEVLSPDEIRRRRLAKFGQ